MGQQARLGAGSKVLELDARLLRRRTKAVGLCSQKQGLYE
jgi:hypothetical protein